MKKKLSFIHAVNCILAFLLAVSPYLYPILVCFVCKPELPFTDTFLKQSILLYFAVTVAIYIPNFIFAHLAPKFGISLTWLAFCCLVVKLVHIPLYVVSFLLAVLSIVSLFLFGGPIIAAIILFMAYLPLLSSSAYGLSVLKVAKIAHRFDIHFMMKHTSRLYIFGLDILSAIHVYKKLINCTLKASL